MSIHRWLSNFQWAGVLLNSTSTCAKSPLSFIIFKCGISSQMNALAPRRASNWSTIGLRLMLVTFPCSSCLNRKCLDFLKTLKQWGKTSHLKNYCYSNSSRSRALVTKSSLQVSWLTEKIQTCFRCTSKWERISARVDPANWLAKRRELLR